MKKVATLSLALAMCAWAADFWTSKPYPEWNEKEVQKIEMNSPWSKQVSFAMGGGGEGGPDRARGVDAAAVVVAVPKRIAASERVPADAGCRTWAET